jgi:hypothetical protein
MARVYAVLFHVSEDHLGTVLSTLSGASTLVSVTPTEKTVNKRASPKVHPDRETFYVGGKRNKGISGEDLVLQVLGSANRVFDSAEVRSKFVQHGFAANSCYSTMSKLVSEKKIRALGNSKFCLPGTTVHMGA